MKYDGTNIEAVLEAHKRWIKKSKGWTEDDRADFTRADLGGEILRGVDLERANLRDANLTCAYLTNANLEGANLTCADLSGADLSGADLEMADLKCADLRGVYLANANLRDADLDKADLKWADLTNADLTDAYLTTADLTGADLRNAKNIPYIPMTCPDTGAFVAWKACASDWGRVIVKLLIPEDAKRISATGRKCRADKAIVQEIQTVAGERLENVDARSMFDPNFTYSVGKTVTPREPFCENRWQECESGIHFYINRQEAVDY